MKIKVYLAGHTEETVYRAQALKYYTQVYIFDPLTEIEEGIIGIEDHDEFTNEQIEKIVNEDKHAITECDILVAYITKFTCGTCMEILHAWNHTIPILVINPSYTLKNDVWLKYHTSKFFDNVDECFKFIIDEL